MSANPRAFKGIVTARQRTSLQRIILGKLKAHEDPSNPYRLPTYRDPRARKWARHARTTG